MKDIYTVFDYVNWRGDLSFVQDPFNEVDSVILSMVCFLDFSDIVPAPHEQGSITLEEAMSRMPEKFEGDRRLGAILPDDILYMSHAAARAPRYKDAKLFAFENTIDEEKEMQFGALSFRLSDGSLFCAFRGTDDTIVGWKEDFNMTFLSHIPAQERAAAYLNEVAGKHSGAIRTGGHSKGGNLAVWAAVHCNPAVRSRIVFAYSNDGPGFTREMLESYEYITMRDRCMNYVPQSSLVGMLMEHDENYTIIYSNKNGLMQHDPYSWAVCRNRYIYLEERSAFGEHSDAAIRLWLSTMSAEERHELVDDLFELLESTGAKTLTELTQSKGVLTSAVKTLAEYDKPRRKRLGKLFARFVAAQVETAAPETELMTRLEKLEKLEKPSLKNLDKLDLKSLRSLLERDEK
ncbi:MAG: DUF2974 domain-containing protein [Oscillospiraceae bacterium]|nr:DUF2974 domain-containing protein [Oscillospiraceae bacterium]